MSIIIRILSISVLCLAVGACQSISFKNPFADDKAKTRASRNQSLEVPPDLVETTNLPTDNVLGTPAEEDAEVLPEALSTELVRDGDKHWLTIDADAAVVWKKLVKFWDKNDINLAVSEPHTGTMETDWILTGTDRRPGAVENLFNNLLSLDKVYDKYLVRLERAGENKTNLFVSFRTSTKQVEETAGGGGKKITEFVWKEVDADPERELKFLRDVAYEMDPSKVLGG